jgi:subtilase family serine protease
MTRLHDHFLIYRRPAMTSSFNRSFRTAALAAALFSVALTISAQTQKTTLPTRHVRNQTRTGEAVLIGRLGPNEPLQLTLALPLRNQSQLENFLREVNDPRSPLFRQFMSGSAFTAKFGPSEEAYGRVIQFAYENNLRVTRTSPNRLILDLTGRVTDIERAFNLTLNLYRRPTGDSFYAPDREPSVSSTISLWHIFGLDNYSIPRPMSLGQELRSNPDATGSGPHGQFFGSDFRAAYYGSDALTGKGQSVGLIEFGGFNPADVTTYFQVANQSLNVTVTPVSTDGSPATCTTCEDGEQALDIEVAVSMAPGMDQVLVYEARNSDVDIFNRMATDNIAKSLSCSWGWSPADPASDDPIFLEFAAQGQTLFVASGDNGAFKAHSRYVYPADDVHVLGVGGTDLTTKGPGGPWQSETSWQYSGGGLSPGGITIPSYQRRRGVITHTNMGSKTIRNVPDVAAEADFDNYICYDGTCDGGWGGTSFAAPRWAGYLALANEEAAQNGDHGLGFLNPMFYSIGLCSSYNSNFHDITVGNNKTYPAVEGYDLVTGWGSPNGPTLIDTLAR